jgi:hypothetical protein
VFTQWRIIFNVSGAPYPWRTEGGCAADTMCGARNWVRHRYNVTFQNFIKFWWEIFAWILYMLIENLQGFKTF